ncbi:MAG: membrane protein insertion efficiency factor YidD [Candidatus Omnitrophica bacterium]|nr:membrane protein insertion efficiency factor YidD [Candidatus Omnitrophota bacterium]
MTARLVLFIIRIYQYTLSPILNSRCRYLPTCSQYAIDCFQKYPFLKAVSKSLLRLIKCNPFSKGGFDPA